MLRLYVDTLCKPIWSVDFGDISTEQRFEEVFVFCDGVTCSDLTSDNINNPKVWIEFYDAVLNIEEGIGYILKRE